MDLVSYAQNFEDVLLWRAFSDVERGFFIDVGAQDPVVDSVSLMFRERGWHGIHLEPTPQFADLLRAACTGDIVIQAAVANSSAPLRFFEIPGGGISTANREVAEQHRARGIEYREITVPSVKLSAIFDLASSRDIHWLKIDVEGFEEEVLTSWGDSQARPWIVVVESTLPLTKIENHHQWERILISYGYRYAYFDGLNRYFVSDSHQELMSAFQSPPNVFDDFRLNGTSSAPFHKNIVARFERLLEQESASHSLQKIQFQGELDKLQFENTAAKKLNAEQASRIDNLSTRLAANMEETAARQQSWLIRERSLTSDLEAVNAQLRTLLQSNVQREREFSGQLTTLNDRAATALRELIGDRDNREAHIRRTFESERAELQSIADARISGLYGEVRKLEKALGTIRGSISWKITTPLRLFSGEPYDSLPKDNKVNTATEPPFGDPQRVINQVNHSRMKLPTVTNLASLLQYEDGDFVDQAYRALLRREPDIDGRQFYIDRIRSGISKLKILTEMSSSPEARSRPPTVKGLRKAIRVQRLSTIPILGIPFRSALHRQEHQATLAKLRTLEQWAIGHLEDLSSRVSILEGRLSRGQFRLEQGAADAISPSAALSSILEKKLSVREEAPELAIEQFQLAINGSLESRLLRSHQR